MRRRGGRRAARTLCAAAGIAALSFVLGHAARADGPGLRDPLTLVDPLLESEVVLEAGVPVLHLVFFATWCKPCLDEMRPLAELEARWAVGGYRLVLVAVPARQRADRLAAFARSSHPPGRLLFDPDGVALRAFGVERLPTHVLLGPRGEELLRAGSVREGVPEAVERHLRPGSGREGQR